MLDTLNTLMYRPFLSFSMHIERVTLKMLNNTDKLDFGFLLCLIQNMYQFETSGKNGVKISNVGFSNHLKLIQTVLIALNESKPKNNSSKSS